MQEKKLTELLNEVVGQAVVDAVKNYIKMLKESDDDDYEQRILNALYSDDVTNKELALTLADNFLPPNYIQDNFISKIEFLKQNNVLRGNDKWYNYLNETGLSIGQISPMSNQDIADKVFESMSVFKNLKSLSINTTKLKHIPDSIFNLKKLTRVFISHNDLKQINPLLFSLPELNNLYIGLESGLKSIPTEISNAKKLKKLTLNECAITHLPESMLGLENLDTLELKYNKNLTISEWIADMLNLEHLIISKDIIEKNKQTVEIISQKIHVFEY